METSNNLDGKQKGQTDLLSAHPVVPANSFESGRMENSARDVTIHGMVEAQVDRTPEAVAVVYGNTEITYLELNRRANLLGRHLALLGVTPEVLVGIYLERSLEMVLAVLAVFKAGGAYVPLDTESPRERLAFITEDSKVTVLLTQRNLVAQFPVGAARVVCLDDFDFSAEGGLENLPAHVAPEMLAYVIHTSGSTGKPKGVLMPQRALVNLLQWHHMALPGACRTLQFAPLNFDVSFQEIFSTWSSGGALLLVSDALRRDPRALWNFIVQEKIQRLFLPFVALQQLAEAADDFPAPELREIITAGEQLRITARIRNFFERNSGCVLHNHYGPTESHVVTAHRLCGSPRDWPALPPVGRPITNAEIHLLDVESRPVSTGEAGEIYIGGACLGRGYLNLPEITAQKFLLHEGRLLYRTGDIGRFTQDGEIEFLGRCDDQVKIRGYRVEPGEIEIVLGEHPQVKQVAVSVREDSAGVKVLAAYVVVPEGFDVSSLRSFAKDKLPSYAVPAFFVPIDSLPLTASGKVDRRSLPVPARIRDNTPHLAPRTPLEKSIAEIWESILQVDNLGVSENFFEVGGDSLRLTSVNESIRKNLKIDVPLTALFEHSTISALAGYLSHRADTGHLIAIRNRAQKQRDAFARYRNLEKQKRHANIK